MKIEVENTGSGWQFYQNKGNNLFRSQRKYVEAIDAFCTAVCHGNKEQQVESFYTRALVYFELSDFENAIADCTAAIDVLSSIDLKGNNVHYISRIYNTRGIAYQHKNEFDKAKADFKIAANLLINR